MSGIIFGTKENYYQLYNWILRNKFELFRKFYDIKNYKNNNFHSLDTIPIANFSTAENKWININCKDENFSWMKNELNRLYKAEFIECYNSDEKNEFSKLNLYSIERFEGPIFADKYFGEFIIENECEHMIYGYIYLIVKIPSYYICNNNIRIYNNENTLINDENIAEDFLYGFNFDQLCKQKYMKKTLVQLENDRINILFTKNNDEYIDED